MDKKEGIYNTTITKLASQPFLEPGGGGPKYSGTSLIDRLSNRNLDA
jgi:hypothetical protein